MFLSSSRGFTELDQQMSRQCRPSGKGGGKNAPIPLLIECPNNLLAVVFVYELSVLLLANLAAVLEHLALLALLQLHALARLSLAEQRASYRKLHYVARAQSAKMGQIIVFSMLKSTPT